MHTLTTSNASTHSWNLWLLFILWHFPLRGALHSLTATHRLFACDRRTKPLYSSFEWTRQPWIKSNTRNSHMQTDTIVMCSMSHMQRFFRVCKFIECWLIGWNSVWQRLADRQTMYAHWCINNVDAVSLCEQWTLTNKTKPNEKKRKIVCNVHQWCACVCLMKPKTHQQFWMIRRRSATTAAATIKKHKNQIKTKSTKSTTSFKANVQFIWFYFWTSSHALALAQPYTVSFTAIVLFSYRMHAWWWVEL